MKNFRRILGRFALGGLFLTLMSCNGCSVFSPDDPLELLCWNVQNLFDGVDNGGEYSEFDPGGGVWTESLFHDRLELLSSAILEICPDRGPDILVLIEVENNNVIEQLNRHYLNRSGYRYRYISQNSSGIQTAILTRCKVKNFRSHRLSLFPAVNEVRLRDITEAVIDSPRGEFVLFINHWKSRLGGAEETEKYRLRAASILNERFSLYSQEMPLLVCGDFNESHKEFEMANESRITALFPAEKWDPEKLAQYPSWKEYLHLYGKAPTPLLMGTQEEVLQSQTRKRKSQSTNYTTPPLFYNPWIDSEAEGSYVYRDEWNALDHFLVNTQFLDGKSPDFNSFEVIHLDKLKTKAGVPKKWITAFRAGYSDHLPILLTIR